MPDIADAMAHPLVQALGWTLIHFIWQGLVVGLLVAGGLGLLRRSSPQARYALGCGGLLVLMVLPVITWWSLGGHSAGDSSGDLVWPGEETGGLGRWLVLPAEGSVTWVPWAVGGWVAGVFLLSLWRTGGWGYTWYLRNRETRSVAAGWQQQLAGVGQRLGVHRAVRLLESLRVEAPLVVGWLRPVILVPVGFFTGLSLEQVEAILAHELAHIRRHDYLVNVLQTVIETLLFYHPAVWWISHRIRVEREYCCDDLAAQVSGGGRPYAEALLAMEAWRAQLPQLALGAAGGRLVDRIRRLVAPPVAGGRSGPALVIPVLVVLTLLAGGAERSYAAAPLPGALLYYPFASKAENRRSVGPPLLVNGTRRVADRFGRPRSAYAFDRGERDLELAGPVSGDFKTIAFWARSEVPIRARDAHLYCPLGETAGVTRANGIGFGHFTNALADEVITLAWEGSCKAYYWTASTFPEGIDTQWHFYAFAWDKAEQAYVLYVDGQPKGRPDMILWNNHSESAPPTAPTPTFLRGAQWHLGRYGVNRDSGWLGALDEVAIFGRPLSAAEISRLYRAEGSTTEEVDRPGEAATAGTATGAADTVVITNVGEVPLRLRVEANSQTTLSATDLTLAPRETRQVAIGPAPAGDGQVPLRAAVAQLAPAGGGEDRAEEDLVSGLMFVFHLHSAGVKYSWVTADGAGVQ